MASTSSENISTVKPRVKGPPCRGWEEMRRLQKRQRTQEVLQAVLEDSDCDEDYEPSSNPETELSSSDAEGTEHEPVSTVAEAPGNEHQQSPVSVQQIVIPKGKKRSDGQKVEWLQIQSLRFEKERPLVMKFKYSLGDVEWSEVDFGRKAGKGRPSTVKEPELLYPVGRSVAGPTMADLKKLLKYVPPVYHSFYASLQTNDAVTVSDVDEQDFDES